MASAPNGGDPQGKPSDEALQWLLVFGGIAPHTDLYKDANSSDNLSSTKFATPKELASVEPLPDDIRQIATDLLDAELSRVLNGRRPLVLFSGGVDSSLMAARLVELGHKDVILIHYQFDDNDPETAAARQIARQLGLELTVVQRQGSAEGNCLESPGLVYPIPFGDQSTSPTAELCQAVTRLADPADVVVFDGTGADGAFGLGARATQAHRDSFFIRAGLPIASAVYAGMLWRTNGKVEHAGRVLRRIQRLKPVAATIAQNSLFDVFYDARDVDNQISKWNSTLNAVGVRDGVGQVVVTDLAITCARIFAQKTYGPLTTAGFDVAYPFLTDSLATLGVRHTSTHPHSSPKAWMKAQLEQHVASALVHRAKSGFIDPARQLFDTPRFQEALQEALDQDSVFADLLHIKRLQRWIKGHGSLSHIPVGHQNLLWTLAFVNRWYHTRNENSPVST